MLNCTAHEVRIIKPSCAVFNNEVRKFILTEPLHLATFLVIPKSGILLSAKYYTVAEEPIDGIPIMSEEVVGVDKPTVGEDCIVSQKYAAAFRLSDYRPASLFCVGRPVYATADGKQPVGVLDLQRA